jgi:hypothetical protein
MERRFCMAQHIKHPKPKRHRSLTDAGAFLGAGSWFSVSGVIYAVSEGALFFRGGLVLLLGGAFVALIVFLAYGGGILIGATDGRYPGNDREFWGCRYITMSGSAHQRLWKAGSGGNAKGCPVLLVP